MDRAAPEPAPVAAQALPPGPHYGYRPQIDGLRALAVSGVMLTHFWLNHWPTGHLGVRLFFVISGFLITERLLDARAAAPLHGQLAAVGWFFLRRALRILPAYYALLGLLLILDTGGIRASAPWHIFQLSNLWFALNRDWTPWPVAHFWSLNIEEQFYLVWPWIFLFLSPCAIRLAVGLTILSGVGFRFLVLLTPLADNPAAIWVLTPASMDTLGVGALLAILTRSAPLPLRFERAALAVAVLWLAIDGALRMSWLPDRLALSYALLDTLSAISFAGLVARCHRGPDDVVGRLLASRPLVALGRISYGAYLYHLPILAGLLAILPDLDYGPRRLVLGTTATLLTAALSWTLLERPLLGLKRRLPG